MGWNPFNDIFNGVSNFASGAYNTISSGIGSIFDMFESGSARRAEQRANQELAISQQALAHQTEQDNWARGFNQQVFDQQKYLAENPISVLVQDGAKNGINPMAAMGQSAGSVSVSPSASSVNNPGSGNFSAPSNLNGLLSIIGGLVGEGIRADTSEGISKRQQATAEYVADKQADTQVKIAEIEDSFKRDELQENQQFHAAQVRKMEVDSEVALRGAAVQEGRLENEKQKRLDELSRIVSENAHRGVQNEIMYKEYAMKEKQLQEAIRNNNMKLAGTIISSLCIIGASIIGGPVGGVAAGAISSWIANGGKNPIGFRGD